MAAVERRGGGEPAGRLAGLGHALGLVGPRVDGKPRRERRLRLAGGDGEPGAGEPGTAAGLNPSTAPGQAQVVAPPIVLDLVPYGPRRKAEMAAFSRRHYGQATWVLHPQAIVLHYTATSTYAAAHSLSSLPRTPRSSASCPGSRPTS